jgi:hypothetical protein
MAQSLFRVSGALCRRVPRSFASAVSMHPVRARSWLLCHKIQRCFVQVPIDAALAASQHGS